ncbi:MAG: glycosyltransferase [Verrucomicrobia bacterium]|jgi:glycosyltransferase involved in cell wall biosynthesis|nr:glycosyltransferase [Verrucomicrobiota bacterium]OQC27386.1 MAG: Glycogen synthase [Verrucomicrobia bacterium ADurb.Bin063]HNW06817.1 glycosyltransferase family 4 protein [Verrucomicrobiota bacterium]HOX62473.1 glycosyltransferase family 4 protein [Verrucomicrobiota bacterium]HPI63922.1 glycosyltransferase family 4 protein [Verrucomicrobiota bacterium]
MRILYVCPYPFLPIRGGGALRSYHLLNQLGRFHEVHLVIPQREVELRRGMEGCAVPQNIAVYSTVDRPSPRSLFDLLPRRMGAALHYRWLRRSWRGPAETTMLRAYHLLCEVLRRASINVVIFNEIATMQAAPLVARIAPRACRIVDMHNVNHRLARRMPPGDGAPLRRRWAWEKECRRLLAVEQNLGRSVKAFFACSEDDRRLLESCSGIKGFSIPNGVDTKRFQLARASQRERTQQLLFCGSLTYAPNFEGLSWFAGEVWPTLRKESPGLRLAVVGRCGQSGKIPGLANDDRVRFVGEVADVQPFYREAAVAICPIRAGSGTRLKILEAMSIGTPVVSTRIGAEGIEAGGGEHLLLADEPAEFAAAIKRLLNEPVLFHRLQANARKLVETRYDWDVVGALVDQALSNLLKGSEAVQALQTPLDARARALGAPGSRPQPFALL